MSERRFAWQVPQGHPAFAGHFPGNPILPGVVLLDRALFLAQQLAGTEMGADEAPGGLAGWTVSQTKFLSPVVPGEELSFTLSPDARGGWRFAVHAADGRSVASGSLIEKKA